VIRDNRISTLLFARNVRPTRRRKERFMDRTSEDEKVKQVNGIRSGSPQRRGPKTAAGKARIALNAITHGLSSTRLVVPGESSTAWAANRTAIVDALAPAGPLETALAERVASTIWRVQRVAAYEEAAIAEREHLETASARLLPHPNDIDKIIRYEAHLTRQLYQALHELESRQAARRGQPAPLLRVDVHGPAEKLAATEAATE
jgi:hypothetical protein